MSEPTRYRVANNQAQLTLGGNILAVDPSGPLVEYADYARLRMERIHDLNQIGGLQEDYARLLADYNKTEEHNMALCERMQDLNGELFNASCANANMHKENARLKAEVDAVRQVAQDNKTETEATRIENARLKAEVERLRKAGDAMDRMLGLNPTTETNIELHKAWNAAKEGKQP